MRIRMLPSAVAGHGLEFLTTFIVNGTVAIDAGALGFWGDLEGQRGVGHVFLSHSHADHVCSLPMFVTNTHDGRARNILVHGHAAVLESLSRDVFNGRVWPDFLRPAGGPPPLLDLEETVEHRACEAAGLRITPVRVDHPVPTMAHLVDDGTAAVVISTDSAPTGELWRVAARVPNLKAVFLGASFPEEEAALARVAGHLVPSQVDAELSKIDPGVAVYAVHIKPGHRQVVIDQLRALARPNLLIGQSQADYVF
jgi:ribonuclease BN (tRNA processing enzyme)